MNQIIMDLFHKLNKIAHAIYSSEDKTLRVWETSKKQKMLYSIVEMDGKESVDIYDRDALIASDMNTDMAVRFIDADLGLKNMGPLIERNEHGFATAIRGGPKIDGRTERVIRQAAEKQGFSGVDRLVKNLGSRKEAGSRTVKRKRKIDVEDLDLDDE